VVWSGGPDLAVPLFIPPVIKATGARAIPLLDITINIGSTPSAPSITRYYLSATQAIDLSTATVLGERSVPALQPGELNGPATVTVQLPGVLSPGVYFIAACADAPLAVVELDETNNCSFSTVKGFASVVAPMEIGNQPPDCSHATPSEPLLWPPNHKLHAISINGVTDPDNDSVTLRITGITQDEPVNGLGDGDTSPDGFGIGQSEARVRAERSGKGNGRVYRIAFTAADQYGGTCQGSVGVGVPRDQGKGAQPIDDGQLFDSTRTKK